MMKIRDANRLAVKAAVTFEYRGFTISLSNIFEPSGVEVIYEDEFVADTVLVAARIAVAEDHGISSFSCDAVSIRDIMAGIDWSIAHEND